MGCRAVGWNFDTGLCNTAEAMMPTWGWVGAALSILSWLKFWGEDSRAIYTHHLLKSCISKESSREKNNTSISRKISWFQGRVHRMQMLIPLTKPNKTITQKQQKPTPNNSKTSRDVWNKRLCTRPCYTPKSHSDYGWRHCFFTDQLKSVFLKVF